MIQKVFFDDFEKNKKLKSFINKETFTHFYYLK